MTTAIADMHLESLDIGVLLASIVEQVRMLIRTKPSAENEQACLAQFAMLAVGKRLLATRSAVDFEERLDAVVTGQQFHQINQLGLKYLTQMQPRDMLDAGEQLAAAFGNVLPEVSARILHEQAEMLESWMMVPLRLLQAHPGMVTQLQQTPPDGRMFTDPALPPAIALVLFDASAASACFLALALAAERGKKVKGPLAGLLVNTMIHGARTHLQFMAGIPGAAVPEHIVPVPMDIPAIVDEFQRANARFDADMKALDDEAI